MDDLARNAPTEILREAMRLWNEKDEDAALDLVLPLYNAQPNNLDYAWMVVGLMERLRMFKELSPILDRSITFFPNHLDTHWAWARLPAALGQHQMAVERFEQASQRFSLDQGYNIQLLLGQFSPLAVLEHWPKLKDLFDKNWNDIYRSNHGMEHILFHLDWMGMHDKLISYIKRQVDRLPIDQNKMFGIDLRNLMDIYSNAVWNKLWKASLRVRVPVVSVGQNCLPFVISQRWGLADLDPYGSNYMIFDMSAFPGDTAADSIETQFAALRDYDSFTSRPFGLHSMVYHAETGVHFAHNTMAQGDNSRMKTVIDLAHAKIERFMKALGAPNNLYVCNVVDHNFSADRLIKVLRPHLAPKNSRLLIVNATTNAIDVPENPNVTYLYHPYPPDYLWNHCAEYSSDRGILYESRIINQMKRMIDGIAATP